MSGDDEPLKSVRKDAGVIFVGLKEDYILKVAAASLKLETRLHAHQVGTNTRSGTETVFTLI